MQFVILAFDGKDPDAPARRTAARPAHLENARKLKVSGNFLEGGAILNDAGEMAGSMLVMEFGSREELDSWLRDDPYTTGDVWREVQVLPYRRAPL
jgi:uncharacterized protein YciI